MYKLTEGTIIIENKKEKSYGIALGDTVTFQDVSTEKSKVRKLVELFNEENIDPRFADVIIEDFLS